MLKNDRKRFTGATDNELRAEIEELKGKLRELQRDRANRFPEDSHEGLDHTIAAAREQLESRLAGAMQFFVSGDPGVLDADLVRLWTIGHVPEFAAAMHRAIDEARKRPASPFVTDMSRAAYRKELERLTGELESRRSELVLRERERELEKARDAMKQAEEELAQAAGAPAA